MEHKVMITGRGNGKTELTKKILEEYVDGAIEQIANKDQVVEEKPTTHSAEDVDLMKHYVMLKNYLKRKPPRNVRKKIRTEYDAVKIELEKRGLI